MKSSIILSIVASALLAQLAAGKILDPGSPANVVLDPLADEINSKGIDVRRRWKAGSPMPGNRPILAPLQGFTSPAEAQTARALWMKDFEGRIHSVLVGVQEKQSGPPGRSTGAQPNLTTFKVAWERAPRSQRVFISFTRADAAHALEVKKALEGRGFTTFVYLEGVTRAPKVAPAEAGHFFATAGHHFVIDTKNARRSGGVWFEKTLLGRYGGTEGGATVAQAARPKPVPSVATAAQPKPVPYQPSTASSVISCTCNTYRNGFLVSSRPIPRGARCGSQVCQ